MIRHPRPRFAAGAALAGVVAAIGLVAAPATATVAAPPWQGQNPATDVNNVGTLTFYDGTGAVITSGSTLTTLGTYVGTTGLTPLSGNSKAVLYAYTPNPSSAPGGWSGLALSGATTWPNAAAPAPLSSNANPVVTESPGNDVTLDDYATNSFPNTSTTTGYQNVYELRVFDTGTKGVDAKYASADVLVDPVAHTWTEVYPTPIVATVPGVPGAVGASAGNGSATVHWTAPSDGGDPITKYTVTYTPAGGAAQTQDVTGATQTTLTSLANGTSYAISVTATNDIGTGAASSPVAVTPRFTTAVSLNATPSSVKAGAAFTVSGALTGGGTLGGQTVALTITPAGHAAQHVNVITTATGAFSSVVRPSYNVAIVARFAGSTAQAPATSVTRRTTANAVLRITSPANGLRTHTRTLRVLGLTTPNKAGATVTLWEKRGTRWVKLAAVRVASTGRFTFQRTFARGTHLLQVRIAATSTNGAGTSATVKLVEL
jgi:titin